jgi:NADPH-dependent 2,4-dienoyl-CoA reductase/sulfur reductase-like enzyme
VAGTRGNLRVSGIENAYTDKSASSQQRILHCDLVLMSGGYTPSVHLFSQSRGKLLWNEAAKVFLPASSAERERSAGACRDVDWEGTGFQPTDIFHGEGLSPGATITGPAIVEMAETTIVVPPGDSGTVDPYGSFVITIGKGAR